MKNKIEQLFVEQDQVSLTKDILPLVLEEFELSCMDETSCAMASEFVKQNLYAIHISGIQTVCYPVFSGEPQNGTLSVVDMVWEKIQIQKIEVGLTNLTE